MDPIKRALTRRRIKRGHIIVEEPNAKLVLVVKFALSMTVCFSGLELVHILLLGSWNSEIFSAIAGLTGTISGIFVGQKT